MSSLGRDDSVVQNALDYGLEATIPSRMISSVVVDAPSGLGGSFTGGEIDILSTSRVLEESVTLALEVMDVDRAPSKLSSPISLKAPEAPKDQYLAGPTVAAGCKFD